MRLSGTKLSAINQYRGLGNQLYDLAGDRPSLDLQFADQKSLVDATTGQNLVTLTRASSGTYVDSQGVIRTAVTNLLLRSEEFNDATWTKTNSTVTTNATTAPNGTLTAEKLITNSGASSGRASVSITVATDTPATLSCYAKQGETNVFGLFISDGVTGRAADFNLSTGTISGTPTAGMSASIQPVGDGWYRCIVTVASASLAGTTRSLRVVQTVVGNDGTSGLFIWGAQFEQSSTVGEYIPTISTINSAPRFDHNPTTGESLGLLVEEQRTNLLLRSEEFETASWTKVNTTVSSNAASAPDGTTTADKLITDNGVISTSAHTRQTVSKTATATTYTLSVFAKTGDSGTGTLQLVAADAATTANSASSNFSTVSGTITVAASAQGTFTNASSIITSLSNGWYRCSLTFTTGTETSIQLRLFSRLPTTGDGTRGLLIWGAQLEAGAFPTSYIPTTTAAATRSADVASITGSNFSSWYRQDQGTVFADWVKIGASNFQASAALSDGTSANLIALTHGSGAPTTNARFDVNVGSISQASLVLVTGSVVGTPYKNAGAYKVNDFAAASNGGSPLTDTVGIIPTTSQLTIGANSGAGFLNGTIRRLTYFPTRLANETLQRITQ